MLHRTAHLALGLTLLASASASAQVSGDPAFHVAAAQDRAAAEQRGADQLANPAYMQAIAPHVAAYAAGSDTDSVFVDPFRHGWAPARGDTAEISYENRYGVTIRGRLWGPKNQRRAAPAVVLIPGYTGSEESYRGLAQGLAEGGYVVLAFDPQAHGDSDARPAEEYCRPGKWQEPQELGIREQGPCAGLPPRYAPGPLETALMGTPLSEVGYQADTVSFLADSAANQAPPESIPVDYARFRAIFVFGAFDAVDWLRSKANPWRDRIMPDRVGVVGHSAGADGAVNAANGDPSRFRAAVGWDSFGELQPSVRPRVPTMLQVSEQQQILGPFRQRPAADKWPAVRVGRAFRSAGVANMTLALRGSTHQEWSHVPTGVGLSPVFGASRLGERVALHYTLAWLDRFLQQKKADQKSGRARLLSRRFDASADASSIGSGTAGADGGNRPYRIAGMRVADQVSRMLPSAYAFDREACADMLSGC